MSNALSFSILQEVSGEWYAMEETRARKAIKRDASLKIVGTANAEEIESRGIIVKWLTH